MSSLSALLFSSAPDPICLKDADGRYLELNPAFEAVFQTTQRTAGGRTDNEIFAAAVAEARRARDREVLATGSVVRWDEPVVDNGYLRVFCWAEFPVEGEANARRALGLVATDITPYHLAQQQLRSDLERACLAMNRLSGDAVILLDANGYIRRSNEAARLLHGFAQEELTGEPWSRLWEFDPSITDFATAALERARSDGRFETEKQCLRKDGSRFRGIVTLDSLSARGEPPTGFVLIVREVQADTAASEKASAGSGPALSVVERSEEINRAVLASLNTHIAVLDRNGTIVTVNASWTKFGRENGVRDIAAISPGASYLDVCRRATGADQLEAEWACQGIQAVLEGVRDEFVLEYPCHSDGVKRWFCMTATPLRLSGGGAVIAHEDITKRVEIERRLQQSEEYYRALIEHALDIVSIIGSDGRVLYDSPAVQRVLGYDTAEIIGENVFDYIHPDDRDAVRQVLRHMVDEPGTPYRAEFRFRHKNGTWRYSESIAKNLLHNPAVSGIIVNSRDITERREAADALREKEAALNRSNEQLRALAARMLIAEEEERRRISRELHDDLNQRLAIVAVDLGRLSRQVPAMPPRQIQKDLHALQRGVATLSEDVRRTAHYLHPSILDDLGLVVALRSWCEDFSQRHSIETTFVHRHVPETLPQDVRTAIYRIVQECLRNVAKHSRTESALVLLGGSRHGLRVTVRDCGVGFDPDSARGHGALGLISIEERARLLGGTVRIRSRLGDGCRVTIQIPLGTGHP